MKTKTTCRTMPKLSAYLAPGALLLAGLCGACEGPDAEIGEDQAALTEETVPILQENAPGQTVFDGVAVPAVAPAVDVLQAARDREVTTYSATFADTLAAQSDTTQASETTAAVVAAARASRTVAIKGQKQQRPMWCVPASSHITLSALMTTAPTQTTLAKRELTTDTNGTFMVNVPGALNAYQTRNHFILSRNTSSASNLVTRVRYDIDTLHSPLIPGIQGSYLPAWRARGYSGRHAVVIYGWNVATKQPYYLNLYDPLNVSWSGPYNVQASTVYTALNANNHDLVW